MNITWAFTLYGWMLNAQTEHGGAGDGHAANLLQHPDPQQNAAWRPQCCCMCAVTYMISETNGWHDIWETIITPPTCTWHFLCDKMNASKKEWGYWIVAYYEWKSSFMIFVPKNFSIPISFSTFMAPKQPFTYNEFAIFHWIMP